MLQFLSDVEKVFGLGCGALGCRIFSLGYDEPVICLRDRHHQAASSDFGVGFGQRLLCSRQTILRRILKRKRLVNDALADVFMDAIIRDVPWVPGTVALGIKVLCVVIYVR